MPNVSVFKNIGDVTNPIHWDLLLYLEYTRDGMWKDMVQQCRDLSDEVDTPEGEKKSSPRSRFKQTMPTATLSGEFDYRADDKLKKHSEFIAMDLDKLEDPVRIKNLLKKDRYVFSVFLSTGANGLRVIFKVIPEKHREAFRGIVSYLFEEYGIICDPNGVNVSKPYIVSHDPTAYINYTAFEEGKPIFKRYIKEKAEKKMADFVHTTSDFDMVLKSITGRGINICEDYNDWIKVGFALANQFGEGGEAAFHEVSRMSQKYDYETTKKQYKYCLRGKGQSPVRISSFYYLAKTHGVEIASEQTKKITRATKNGKKSGLDAKTIIKNLKELEGIEGADELVEKLFELPFIKGDDEDEESILHLLEMFISSNYTLKMNEVTGYLEQNGVALTPADLNTIFIAAKKVVTKLDYQLMLRLLKSDFIESYNPFFKFFGSDGIPVELPATPIKDQNGKFKTPIIDKLAQTIKNSDPNYTHYFLRKWMVSIVSAAHKVHSPLLFCLIGGQNTGKTEWFRRLCPPELKPYYAESKLDKEKDDELLMTESLIIMDDELGGKSKQETLKLNNITSKDAYYIRRPYGDHNERLIRLAVLCGTSNYYSILNDPTGNRRIIPVIVEDIDKELYNSIDKRQLFMEAFRLYKEGFDWRITLYDINYLNIDKEKFESIIKEKELIQKYYEPGNEYKMTTTDIVVELDMLTKQKINAIVLGRELINLKFERKTVRTGESTVKKWFVNKIGRSQDADKHTEEPPF